MARMMSSHAEAEYAVGEGASRLQHRHANKDWRIAHVNARDFQIKLSQIVRRARRSSLDSLFP